MPRATVAREILPDTLRKMGATIDIVPAYQTIAPIQSNSNFLQRLDEGSIDVITFTSSSTVNNFLDHLDKTIAIDSIKLLLLVSDLSLKKPQKIEGLKLLLFQSITLLTVLSQP